MKIAFDHPIADVLVPRFSRERRRHLSLHDVKGQWGIDVEIPRQVQLSPCAAFHVDSLVRILIGKPNEDYPAQWLGAYFPDGKISEKSRFADSEIRDAKYYWIVLVVNGKASGSI